MKNQLTELKACIKSLEVTMRAGFCEVDKNLTLIENQINTLNNTP